jgi:hypothetical protein
MSRRIEIELTSQRDDGTWTWRAPGAKKPKGSLDGGILPSVAKVGDVLRADADFELEGITVVAVLAPRTEPEHAPGPERIEIIGSGKDKVEGVSVTLVPGNRRPRDDGDRERRPRSGRPSERGAPRTGRPAGGPGGGRGAAGPDDKTASSEGGGRPRPTDRARPGRGPEQAGRPPRPERSGAERSGAERSGAPDKRGGEDRGAQRRERPRKAEVVTTNRNAALAALSPEQIPVAEQLLRGGIPAVRQAIDEQNTRARTEGRAEVSPQPLLTMAEELLPRMNLAAWKDRAVTLRSAGRDAPLREMRSVVAGASTVTLDEEGRELVGSLRESLDTRVAALRVAWLGRITTALDDNRVADALRVAARPPEPTARVPADMAVRLAETAGTAMVPTVTETVWMDLLDAVINSPVKRTVKPAGLPAGASAELLTAARHAAGLVPELARLLGLPIPPPPGPRRTGAVAARRG